MNHILCIFGTIVFLTSIQLQAQDHTIDSIRNIIPSLEGQDRLDAYSNLSEIVDGDQKLKVLNEYIHEASQQKSLREEAFARYSKLIYFYNRNMEEDLLETFKIQEAFTKEHEIWDYYFNAYDLIIQNHLSNSHFQTALHEAKKMQEFASEINSSYGLGVSYADIGRAYQIMGRHEVSLKFFKDAVSILKNEKEKTLLLDATIYLSQALLELEMYDEMSSVLHEREVLLLAIEENLRGWGLDPGSELHWFHQYVNSADMYMHIKDFSNATYYLKKAQELVHQQDIPQRYLNKSYLSLYRLEGKYTLALDMVDQQYEDEIECGNIVGSIEVLRIKANLLQKVGKGTEAADLYEEYISKNDSVRSIQFNSQLDELHKIYEVDKLELQAKWDRNLIWSLSVVCVLLLISGLLTLLYSRRLRAKNRILYEQICEQDKLEQEIEEQNELISEKTTDANLIKNGILFIRLKELMKDENIYTNSDIDRKTIADMLGTNEKYLFDTIKENTGLSFSEYIAAKRLNLAKKMLSNKDNLTMEDIAYRAGFGSSRTFYRQFRDKYDLSPTEYRRIALEKNTR